MIGHNKYSEEKYSFIRQWRITGRGMVLDREVIIEFLKEMTFDKRPELSKGKG